MPKPLLLTLREMQRVTGGRWRNLPEGGLEITGANFYLPRVSANDLFLCLKTEEDDIRYLVKEAFKAGAVAALVREGSLADSRHPLLEVHNPAKALQDLALAASFKFDGTRILVTGSHGKTAFKTQLYHLIRKQIPTSAYLGSANKEIPVYRALTGIAADSRVVIVETAVPARGIGEDRAFFIRPDYCVITGIGPEHLKSHKSMENLIRNKAAVVTGLREGGKCLLNADDAYFGALKEAVRGLSACAIQTFGSQPECQGRLIAADFEDFHWQVRAEILGEAVEYRLPLLESYAPLASVGVLLMAKLLGADIQTCAREYADYRNYVSSGNLYRVPLGNGHFFVYDQSQRAELKGFESMFELMSRLHPHGEGRKIVVMSEFFHIADNPGLTVDYPRMQALMAQAGIGLLYTIMDFKQHQQALPPGIAPHMHGETPKQIREDLLRTVRVNDMIFLRADPPAKLGELVDDLLKMGGNAVEKLY